jgi:hypothetical protein
MARTGYTDPRSGHMEAGRGNRPHFPTFNSPTFRSFKLGIISDVLTQPSQMASSITDYSILCRQSDELAALAPSSGLADSLCAKLLKIREPIFRGRMPGAVVT